MKKKYISFVSIPKKNIFFEIKTYRNNTKWLIGLVGLRTFGVSCLSLSAYFSGTACFYFKVANCHSKKIKNKSPVKMDKWRQNSGRVLRCITTSKRNISWPVKINRGEFSFTNNQINHITGTRYSKKRKILPKPGSNDYKTTVIMRFKSTTAHCTEKLKCSSTTDT